MSVTGYLALYTTLIGWQQYQNLWDVMVTVGIVFIPFIGIVLQCFLEPFESQEPKSAAVIAMRRLAIRIIGALLIIEFCCVPAVPLDPKVLHFEPDCVSGAQVATPGHTGTTYDNQFSVPTGVKVPVLWYLVMAVSNGFTHAAIEGFSCAPINYRDLQQQLDVTHITDPNVKQETINFYNDCYVPAFSKYMSNDLTDTQKADIQLYQEQYGKDDLGWIGSQAFLNTPGFYDALNAHEPIEGFLYDPTRDQFEGQVTDHSKWGQPSCQAWWREPNQGLHAKLAKTLPTSLLEKITHIGSDPTVLADASIRNLIKHSFDPGMSLGEITRGYESLTEEMSGHYVSRFLGSNMGIALEQLSFYPKLILIIQALPIIQALLLMSIYTLLALLIPFSNYRLSFIITSASIIFAITFWSYLWHLVLYLDNTLIPALYPSAPTSIKTALADWLQGNGGLQMRFIDIIIGTLYIALPALFLLLMSWAGIKISSAITQVTSGTENLAGKAGEQAGNMAKTAGRNVISSLK